MIMKVTSKMQLYRLIY